MVLALRETPDGGTAAGAVSDSFGPGYSGAWLLRLGPGGQPISQRIFRSDSIETIGGISLEPDGGALVAGARLIGFNSRTGWVARVDPAGTIGWATSFFTGADFGRHFLLDATRTPDGGILASGFTSDYDFPPFHGWIVRLDPAGSVLWQSLYGAGDMEEARRILATADGGFVAAGITAAGAGARDGWVMKADAAGDIAWQVALGGSGDDEIEAIAPAAGGGWALAGTTSSFTADGHSGWVLRLDAQGALLWARAFEAWSDFHGIAETPGGALRIAGRLSAPGEPANEHWIVELESATGAVRSQRAFPGGQGGWTQAIAATADGGALAGGADSWGFPGQELRLLRLDPSGRPGLCPIGRETAIPSTEPRVTAGPGAAARSPAPQQVGTLAFLVEETSVPVADGCDPCLDAGGAPPPEPSPQDAAHPPLRVRPGPDGPLVLESVAGAAHYNFYVDAIGSWYSPTAAEGSTCTVRAWTDNGDGTLSIPLPLPRGSWVVATAGNACGESGAGRSSAGVSRFTVGTWQRCPVCP